jgi:hypothetical protein
VKSGSLFGEGIYFADMATKSLGYCSKSKIDTYFMLLCEVSLGNMKDVKNLNLIDEKDNSFNSVKFIIII